MSGITDELFVGIPQPKENHFDFLKMGFIKEIQMNKDKRILLVLDEINRTPERLRSVLFSLFEKMIDEEYFPNLDIVCCINDGDDYELNWDITSDAALFSRITLIEYSPDKLDAIAYMRANNYNKMYVDALERVPKVISYRRTDNYEQTANYRSHAKMAHVLAKSNASDIRDVSTIFHKYGLSFMNKEIFSTISNVLQSMIHTVTTYNIVDIIQSNTMPNKDVFEIMLAIKDFVTSKENKKFTEEYISNIMNVLSTNKEILIQTIVAVMKEKIVPLDKCLPHLSVKDKQVIVKLLH